MGRGERNQGRRGQTLNGPSSLNAAIWSVCDIMRRSNCAGAMQYVPELTWLLFLRILDEREAQEEQTYAAVDAAFTPSLEPPYRWRDWAAPDGSKRLALAAAPPGATFGFVNQEVIPYLRALKDRPGASGRQRTISEILSGTERTRIDTERNFLDVLDKLHEISAHSVDTTHVFPLSQVYEGLLLKMGEKRNDGGQFFTPREVIRAMVRVVDPRPGTMIYDPCCGTGGFLVHAMEHIQARLGTEATPADLEALKRSSFYGREKENLIYPVSLANLVLHGVDEPHIWHGNTLTGAEAYGGLWSDAPALFDVVLTNPPFGGKEGNEAQARFTFKTSATQMLFLQHVIDSLAPEGKCAIVLDEGALFRITERAFVGAKRRLLDTCDLWCIVSLPAGVFVSAGAGVKANLLFFTRGARTEKIWYYDLSEVKIGKRTPLTLSHFDEFFRLLPDRADSDRSWTVTRAEIEARGFDLKAANPHRRAERDHRSPTELLDLIGEKGREVETALATLRGLLGNEAGSALSEQGAVAQVVPSAVDH